MNNVHRITSVQLLTMLIGSALTGACAGFIGVHSTQTSAAAATAHSIQQKNVYAASESKEKTKMGRPVVHFEIGCRNTAKTSDFYSKLFDWQIDNAGPAAMVQTHGGSGIDGHITALGHEPEHYVTFYVEVEDIKDYLDKAIALGGKTVVPPIPIPTGTFAWFADPDGNIIGLLQPKKL